MELSILAVLALAQIVYGINRTFMELSIASATGMFVADKY